MRRLVATYSQHFLRNPAFIAALVGHSNIHKNDTVLDIGAGSGAITAVLARRCKHVIAYEPEPAAVAKLRQNMAYYPNVEVVAQDFLTAQLPHEPYKIFANIPFHLSSPIVRKLAYAAEPPVAIYLIVQKQFAQKMIQGGSHFHGALGTSLAPWWVARIRRPLRKTDFTPPPAVDAVLLELKPRTEVLLAATQMVAFEQFVHDCYADPRRYTRAGGPQDKKPSQLPVEAWIQLFSR